MRSGISFISVAELLRGDGRIAYPKGLLLRHFAVVVGALRAMVCCAARQTFVWNRTCFIALIWVWGFFAAANATPAQDALTAKIDAIFSPLANGKSPGIAVLVRKGGRTMFERGYGARELRTRAKIDAQTNFRLASCSKQFTAAAIMLLARDGKLRYEDKLTDVFPEFPAYGKTITIRNLLNHTSGLPDYEDLMAAEEKARGAAIWSETRQIQDSEVLRLL